MFVGQLRHEWPRPVPQASLEPHRERLVELVVIWPAVPVFFWSLSMRWFGLISLLALTAFVAAQPPPVPVSPGTTTAITAAGSAAAANREAYVAACRALAGDFGISLPITITAGGEAPAKAEPAKSVGPLFKPAGGKP